MNSGNAQTTSFTTSKDSQRLGNALLNFIDTHKNDIQCTKASQIKSRKHNEYIRNTSGNNYDDLQRVIDQYKASGNKFFFFSQDTDREPTITKLTQSIARIRQFYQPEERFDPSDSIKVAKSIQVAINETIESHKTKSVAGSWGITESRLANELQDYLTSFMKKHSIEPEDVEVENRVTFNTTVGVL
jgi:hypothetical protein